MPVAGAAACVAVAIYHPAYVGWSLLAVCALALPIYRLTRLDQRRVLARFMRVFDNVPAGMILFDLQGRVEWINRAIETMSGRTLPETIGLTLSELMGADCWDRFQSERRTLLDGGRLDLGDRLTSPDGGTIAISASATLIRGDDGRPEYVAVQVLDLPGTRNAAARATQREERLLRTLDLSSELIINTDSDGRITYANSSAADLLIAPGDHLEGRNVLDYVAQADQQDFLSTFESCQLDTDQPAELSSLRLQPSGTTVPRTVSASMAVIADTNDALALVCKDTHEQLASLAQLRSSEARFSRIFHTSPDAILIVRRWDSLILDFNASFTRILGYSREDAIGSLEMDLGLFADPMERRTIVREFERTREATDLETQMRTKDGRLISVEISLRYVEIDGELCALCIGRDISERLQAEAALKASEEKFEQVFRRSPDGIVILKQSDLSIYDINDSFLEAAQYSRDELVGRSLYELTVFADQDDLAQATDVLSHQGFFSNREMVFYTKGGFRVQSLVSATYIEINNDPCILCIVKNVNELRQAEEKLRESELRFRSAFENSPIGILLIDTEGKVFQANNFAIEMLGYEKRSLEGHHVSRLVPPEDRSQLKQTLSRLVGGREAMVRTECRMLREDGLEIWTTLHAVLERDASSKPAYLIVQVADITETKNNRSKMERMAFYDTLTDLANRRLFHDRLGKAVDHAQRAQHLSALLYLDLDQFKRVNDTLGHEAGDVLLQKVSTRLSECVRREDTVARLGGDEFTVLLFNITSASDASFVADKILSALRAPLHISGHQLVITTSIGIAIVPQDGTDPNSLMKNADLAMYRAKENGRNTYHFYSEELNTNAVRRLRTENELRQAQVRNEFILHYQPKVRLDNREIVGMESLVRWNHPERGILPPSEFIEIAEETGAIVDLGKWIIHESCRTGRILNDHARRAVQMAVNISPRQFRDPDLVPSIRRILRETGMDPRLLEIEITETMLMSDVDAASATVQQLHALGVRLAIDDFGTGYSSLTYLKKFPIDTVKVDRSFIMDIPASEDDKAITSAVIAMAHRLNMEVVAEGVETREQYEFLVNHDCDFAQGYLFSRPLPLENILPMIQPNVRIIRGQ